MTDETLEIVGSHDVHKLGIDAQLEFWTHLIRDKRLESLTRWSPPVLIAAKEEAKEEDGNTEELLPDTVTLDNLYVYRRDGEPAKEAEEEKEELSQVALRMLECEVERQLWEFYSTYRESWGSVDVNFRTPTAPTLTVAVTNPDLRLPFVGKVTTQHHPNGTHIGDINGVSFYIDPPPILDIR